MMSTPRVPSLPSILALVVLLASFDMKGLAGGVVRPLEPAGAANVLLFVATDCPVSNGYAPEIQRLCGVYGGRGVRCVVVYEDPDVTAGAARAHLRAFGYGAVTAVVDEGGRLAAKVGATITPEVAVVDRAGAVRYRGRIDNQYAAIGKTRRVVTSHDLAAALDAVLAGRAVAAPQTQAVGCFIVPSEMRRKS